MLCYGVVCGMVRYGIVWYGVVWYGVLQKYELLEKETSQHTELVKKLKVCSWIFM